MKINGEFILREVVGEYVLVPVGDAALELNGLIVTDPVGAQIWRGLEEGLSYDGILSGILDRFEVSADVARQDLNDFLQELKEAGLLTDDV